ncbi:DUF6573 family protein [Glutamicibacter arilaitensis]|uniref:DUF6573 family protein n=1 Tax=Glutamicibacter arilaitensis TaxID=256701 RepID=UPI003FD239FF
MKNLNSETIHTFTREQAIRDGILVDVAKHASEYGFAVPLALTAGAWASAVAWDGDSHQDERGRLTDIFLTAAMACRGIAQSPRRNFIVYRVINDPTLQYEAPSELILSLVLSGGDHGEPVLTIMLPEED